MTIVIIALLICFFMTYIADQAEESQAAVIADVVLVVDEEGKLIAEPRNQDPLAE